MPASKEKMSLPLIKRPGLQRTKTTLDQRPKTPGGILKLDRSNTFQAINNPGGGQSARSVKKSMFSRDGDEFCYIAAIEIGTSYSGYAFCERREGKSIAQHIDMNPIWVNDDKTLSSWRTPTCILLNDRKEFIAFGYEAQAMYLDLVRDNRTHKAYYFTNYKSKLFGIKDLKGTSMITDDNERQLSALKVFSLTIRYLKSHILNEICLRGKDMEAEDIRWVLTIPSCWTEEAKQFMRRAAEKAGIPQNMLKLCLEPEAASIYCQNVPPGLQTEKMPIYKSGSKYAIADLGGGLSDLVIHEKRKDGLREVSRGMGAKIGGNAVDEIFIQFLQKLLGDDIVDGFKYRYKKDYVAMMTEFEQEKQKITPEKTSSITLRIPACLQVLCQRAQYNDNLANLIYRSVYQGRVKVMNHKFIIDAVISNELFRATTIEMSKLISHALSSLETSKDVSILVATGGFAKNLAVQEILNQNLVGKSQIKQIFVPPESDLAVLRGAVIFGNNPETIVSRVVRQTIGLRIARLFNPEMHAVAKKSTLHGSDYVLGIFSPFLTIGTRVPVGFLAHQALTTTEPMQKKIDIDIYQTPSFSHSYVTDEGCELLGKIEYQIPMPSTEGRTIYVDLMLGDTELYLFVTDKKTTIRSRYRFPAFESK